MKSRESNCNAKLCISSIYLFTFFLYSDGTLILFHCYLLCDDCFTFGTLDLNETFRVFIRVFVSFINHKSHHNSRGLPLQFIPRNKLVLSATYENPRLLLAVSAIITISLQINFGESRLKVYFWKWQRECIFFSSKKKLACTFDMRWWRMKQKCFQISGKHCFHKINFWNVARFLFKRVFKFLFLLIILYIFYIIILKPRYNFFYRKILFFVNIKINKRKQNIKQFYSQNQILKKRIFKIFNCITFH